VNDYPVAGHQQIPLDANIFFGGSDHLAELSFQLVTIFRRRQLNSAADGFNAYGSCIYDYNFKKYNE